MRMMRLVLVPFALTAGTAVFMQFGVKSQLRGVAGGPGAVSFVVGVSFVQRF